MVKQEVKNMTQEELHEELRLLRDQLEEATETIEAIRTGQIDALVVQSNNGHQLYTLKSADQTYRVFIEKMTEGALTVNRDGLILYCNSQFARMVQLPLSQVIGMPFEQFIDEENRKNYRSLFDQCWQSDCKGEVWLVAGEARTPVQLSLTTIDMDEGVSLSIILTDMTLQKKTQLQLQLKNQELEGINLALEASNHDLQQFASVASHDLQEPLRKIQIFSNLIKDRQMELSEDSKKYLQKVIDSSARMKALILDILNYSRLSADDHPSECTDLSDLLREVLEDFELIIADKNALITYGELPCMEVNRGQIRQVFQNIISNALKFTRQGVQPEIRIKATTIAGRSPESAEMTGGPYALITIEDNGIGFDEKYLNNIFALFERLNSKDKFEGTGIGMAIAKKILEKHQGSITATSKIGRGSRFLITLPYRNS